MPGALWVRNTGRRGWAVNIAYSTLEIWIRYMRLNETSTEWRRRGHDAKSNTSTLRYNAASWVRLSTIPTTPQITKFFTVPTKKYTPFDRLAQLRDTLMTKLPPLPSDGPRTHQSFREHAEPQRCR